MKRLLLANFAECPENLHFERAFVRAAAARKLHLDIIHDFDYHYDFLGALPPPGGRRFKYTGLESLAGCAGAYNLLVLLDFPKRARCAQAFLRLARGGALKKIFVANHLLPMPGHNFTADLCRRLKALAAVDEGCVLDFDDAGLWGELGFAGARLSGRGYSTDCEYYTPQKVQAGNYVFSAGSAGRDFKALAAGVKACGLDLKIFSDAKEKAGAGVEFLPLAKNLHNLRAAAAGAKAVVIPVSDAHMNEAAGNSIAFLSMALGRPVLTRRTRYMEKFITDGKNGFLYKNLSAGSIERGLRRIGALSPARLSAVGIAARSTILRHASLDRFCGDFLKQSFK